MYKQVIILRKDLGIDKGKMVSQGAHAAVGAMRKIKEEVISEWEAEGSKKVVLKVNTLQELKEVENNLKKVKIPYFLVKDAGLTQVKAGTTTALGIGPIEERRIDKITGKLKLL